MVHSLNEKKMINRKSQVTKLPIDFYGFSYSGSGNITRSIAGNNQEFIRATSTGAGTALSLDTSLVIPFECKTPNTDVVIRMRASSITAFDMRLETYVNGVLVLTSPIALPSTGWFDYIPDLTSYISQFTPQARVTFVIRAGISNLMGNGNWFEVSSLFMLYLKIRKV